MTPDGSYNWSTTVSFYTYGGDLSQINDVFNNTLVVGNMVTDVKKYSSKSDGPRYILMRNLNISDSQFASGLNSIFTVKGSFKVTVNIRTYSRNSGNYTVKVAHLTCNNGVASWTFDSGTLSPGTELVCNPSTEDLIFHCQVRLDTIQPL